MERINYFMKFNKMNIGFILVLVILLATIGFATFSSVQPINQVFDTNKCFQLQPKAFIDDDSGLQLFGLVPTEVYSIAPALTILSDPFSPYDVNTNPPVAINYAMVATYCLVPFQKMKSDLTDINNSFVDLNKTVKDLNAQKEMISTSIVASIGLNCNSACNALDGIPTSANWTCIGATTLLGSRSTCTATLVALNCACST